MRYLLLLLLVAAAILCSASPPLAACEHFKKQALCVKHPGCTWFAGAGSRCTTINSYSFGFTDPCGVAIGQNDRVWTLWSNGQASGKVTEMDMTGTLINTYDLPLFVGSNVIHINPVTNAAWVLSAYNNAFDSSLFILSNGQVQQLNYYQHFSYYGEFAFDYLGNAYMSTSLQVGAIFNATISVFNKEGTYLKGIPRPGNALNKVVYDTNTQKIFVLRGLAIDVVAVGGTLVDSYAAPQMSSAEYVESMIIDNQGFLWVVALGVPTKKLPFYVVLYKFSTTTLASLGVFQPKALHKSGATAAYNWVGDGFWICAGDILLMNPNTGNPEGTLYVPKPGANDCFQTESITVDGNGYVWWISPGNNLLYRALYERQT
jgi:hypothetical protein